MTDAIADLANLCDLLMPGTGEQVWKVWSSYQPVMHHQIGLALAATSGAATEYHYYGVQE